MPVKPLPVNPNLDHLKAQAKDLLKARVQCEPAVAQLCGAVLWRSSSGNFIHIFTPPRTPSPGRADS